MGVWCWSHGAHVVVGVWCWSHGEHVVVGVFRVFRVPVGSVVYHYTQCYRPPCMYRLVQGVPYIPYVHRVHSRSLRVCAVQAAAILFVRLLIALCCATQPSLPHRYPALSRAIMCVALRSGLVDAEHAWVMTGQNPAMWWKREAGVDKHDCTDDELKRATQGYMAMGRDVLGVQARAGVAEDRLLTGETPAEWRVRYAAASGATPISDFGPLAYDAGWAFGKALHAMLTTSSNAENAGQPYTLADLTSPTASTAKEMRRVLKSLAFFGASGPVAFDATTGDRTYVERRGYT